MDKPVSFFTKSVELLPIRKGLYKDAMQDTQGFQLRVAKAYKQRKWGDDDAYDSVMQNFGQSPLADNEHSEQRLVFGWANVALQEDGTAPFEWQNDRTPPEVLESAAYNYVLNYGISNQEHLPYTDCGWLVESIMFTKEKMAALNIPEGIVPEGWWVGFYIPDPAVFELVKNGTFNMFSIEGYMRRE